MMYTTRILCLACLALVACHPKQADTPVVKPALVMTIHNQGSHQKLGIVGEVKSRFVSAEGFRVAGKIIARHVEVGTMIKKGQRIAQLDSQDAKLNVQSAKADVSRAEAQFELAKANLARQKQLVDKQFISAATLDSFEAQFKSAQAQLSQTKAQVNVSGNQSQYTTLHADRDGVVTMIRAEPGQVVAAGELIVNIADTQSLEVEVALPESRRSLLQEGDPAKVILWANQSQFYDARVREIAPAADSATRSFIVKVSVLSPDSDLRLGMTAAVKFDSFDEDNLLIPSTAVTQQNQQPVVWIVEPKTNKVRPQEVTIGDFREDGVSISQGLNNGDRIVTVGVQNLVAGQTVTPVERGLASKGLVH